jgi:hypothetical protein
VTQTPQVDTTTHSKETNVTTASMNPADALWLHMALQQSCNPLDLVRDGFHSHSTEAIRSLELLQQALLAMPLSHEGPARQHLNWADLARRRAQQALVTLPEDRTASTTAPRARVGFGLQLRQTGDWLSDSLLPDQSRLAALRDDVGCALAAPDCQDARLTATTVRDLIRSLTTYLAEVELGHAADQLGFTYDSNNHFEETP